VEYLGYTVSHEGIKVDHNKIKSMMEWTISKTLNNIRGFLGLVSYYHNFFKNYGKISTSLTTLLKKEAFSWTQEAITYFEKHESMCTILVMSIPNFTKILIVECDASRHGIGAILMQEGRPLTF
jgi:hypothetical protein